MSRPKTHIKRVRLRLTGEWVWMAGRGRTMTRGFAASRNFRTLALMLKTGRTGLKP